MHHYGECGFSHSSGSSASGLRRRRSAGPFIVTFLFTAGAALLGIWALAALREP